MFKVVLCDSYAPRKNSHLCALSVKMATLPLTSVKSRGERKVFTSIVCKSFLPSKQLPHLIKE